MVRMSAGPGAPPVLRCTSRRRGVLEYREIKIYRIFCVVVEPEEGCNARKFCEGTHGVTLLWDWVLASTALNHVLNVSSLLCVRRPQQVTRGNVHCPQSDHEHSKKSGRRRARHFAMGTCGELSWKPASRWRARADPTPSYFGKRHGGQELLRTLPTGTFPAIAISCKRSEQLRSLRSLWRLRPRSPACGEANFPRNRHGRPCAQWAQAT